MDEQYKEKLTKSPQSPIARKEIHKKTFSSKRRLSFGSKTPEKSPKYSCRFIPSRGSDLENGFYSPTKQNSSNIRTTSNEDTYQQLLMNELLSPMSESGVFRYQIGSPSNQTNTFSPTFTKQTPKRKICTSPFKILDAPALEDDYYLNLLDWGKQNILAVGLANCVYLLNMNTSKISKISSLDDDSIVTSVAWMDNGTHLAFGSSNGSVQLWDVQELKKVQDFDGHEARVGCLSWNSNILSSGSRDRSILERDIRRPHITKKMLAHRQEVCGLKWSHDGRTLASGGNDNLLFIWKEGFDRPIHKFTEHTAAVKALAWSPHNLGVLASGGGSEDKCIRFWNTISGTSLNCIDTGSQVCNLVWSANVNEIVSTHGYSQNQIIVWKYPQMTPLATLTGHSYRVLYLASSPDGQTIVTGAGDETLRFWNVFPPKTKGSQTNTITLNIR